jgi:glycosyltransferase involved in cell wall biosynthesis
MRLLWIKVGGLWPANTGGRLRSLHLLAELSRRHRLTLLTTHAPGEDPQGLRRRLPHCERIVSLPYAVPKWTSPRFLLMLLGSWLSPLPVDLWKCRVPALRREAARLMAVQGIDLCVADFLVAMPNVPVPAAAPVAYFSHNVEYMIWRRLCDNERRPWRRALLEIEWRKMRRAEAEACRRARLTLAVSPQDRVLLRALAPHAVIRAIPTGVDVDYFAPCAAPVREDELVYVGSMDWQPNEDGVLHFIDAILPVIRRTRPRSALTVVGRNPSERLRRAAAAAGVHVTGTVEDVRPYLAAAAVMVVPLRVGGGTRLKIFEGLAAGKAVVSTAIGAEGLPLEDGVHFLRADEPESFAAAVLRLLDDPELRRRLGGAGRRLVEERYAWSQVALEFEDLLEGALNEPVTAPPISAAPLKD